MALSDWNKEGLIKPKIGREMGNYLDGYIQSDEKINEVDNSILNNLERFRASGIEPPEDERGVGVLERLGSLIRVLEPAPYVMAKRKDQSLFGTFKRQVGKAWETGIMGREYEYKTPLQKKIDTSVFSDVFEDMGWEADDTGGKFARAAVGLGLDILVDPKTYLTFGATKATKLFVPNKGIANLNSFGENLLKKNIRQFGEEAGRKMVATRIAKTGDRYLAKEGLKWMGREILPKEAVKAPIKFVDNVLEKIPIEGKIYKGVKGWLGKAFNPWNEIDKLPPNLSHEYKKIVQGFYKGTREKQEKAVNSVVKFAQKKMKAHGDDIGFKLPEYIEKGGKVANNEPLNNLVKWFAREHRKILKGERSAGLKVGEIEGYIRHYLTKEGQEFLQKSKDPGAIVRAMKNVTKKKGGFAKGRKILASVNDVNKEVNPMMKRLGIKGNFFEPNAFKLLAQRKAESVKAIKEIDFFDDISQRFGFHVDNLSPERFEKLNIAEKIGQRTFNDNGIKYMESGIKGLENVFLPEPIIKHLKEIHGVITQADEPAGEFIKLYDKVLRWWKASVTGWFPAFHSRNMIGGVFNNYLAGVTNPKWYKYSQDIIAYKGAKDAGKKVTKKTITLAGKEFSFDDIIKMAENDEVFGMPGMADVMRTMDDQIRAIEKTEGLSTLKRVLTNPRSFKPNPWIPPTWMEAVETRVRMPLFLNRLDKGDDAFSAAKQVFKFHFDYTPEALSTFERNVMKRVVPFYTWTRNNIPLQFEMLAKQPGKYAGMYKLRNEIEAVSGTERVSEEREYMPEWMREMFTIRMPFVKNSGEPYYLQLDLPMEDLSKLNIREITSLMSPLLKYPIERIANKNLYFDTPIYNDNLPREYQLKRTMSILKNLPKPVKDFLNIQEISKKNYYTEEFEPVVMMDSQKLHFIQSLWTSRFYSTFMRAFAEDTPIKEKLSRLVLGEPLRPLEISESKWRELKNKDVMLRDFLYHMLQTERMPYKGDEEGFVPGTDIPDETFFRKIGEMIP